MLFRTMTPGQDGFPLAGRSKRQLGVVIPGAGIDPRRVDIAPDPGGDVHPRSGGMSVAPETMWNLRLHRRPRGMSRGATGQAIDRVYAIYPVAVSTEALDVRATSPVHSLVEPSRPMDLATYERALAATRAEWHQVWP